jgi:hypothetical protein
MPVLDGRARGLLSAASILVLAAAAAARPAAAASRLAADPNELYERSSARLEKGDLPGAAAEAAKLYELVHGHPEWDPEGSFARTLLPPLQARIRRLKGASAALDQFNQRAIAELKPPDLKSEISTVRDYTHWATSVVQRLRSERDAVITSSLARQDEQAILRRTPAYARSERLFESDVLKQMADKTGDDILGLLSGDPRLESVLVRFRQLKRDLMQAIAERDALQARLEAAGSPDARAPRRGWIPWIIAALSGAVSGVCARLALDRGRRLAALEARLNRFDHTVPGAEGPDAGRRAA